MSTLKSKVDIKREIDIIDELDITQGPDRLVNITPGFVLLLTAITVLSGLPMLVLTLAAAAFHELGHIAAVVLSGGHITGITLTATGAGLRFRGSPGYLREAAAALAGPLASAFLAAACLGVRAVWPWPGTASRLSELSALSLLYCLFNLLPMSSTDGGRALAALAGYALGPEVSERLCLICDIVMTVLLTAAGIYVFFASKGNLSVLICAVFMANCCCKSRGFSVE